MRNIFVNGCVYTMDPRNERVEAIVTEKGKIIFAGHSQEALKYKDEDSLVVDLNERLVVPGFNDAHMHLVSYGAALGMRINLGTCKSFAEMISISKKFIENTDIPKGTWIMGRGWNEENFTDERRIPDRSDLDQISDKYPLYFVRSCNSVVSVNSKVLEIVESGGFHEDMTTEKLPDGFHNGVFSGRKAADMVYSWVPEVSVEEIKCSIEAAVRDAACKGLTSCQTDDFETFRGRNYKKILQAYKELQSEGRLTLRVYQQCRFNEYDTIMDFLDTDFNTGQGDDIFKIGPVKIIADGGLTYRTAYLNEPYADDNTTCGEMNYTQEQIESIVAKAAAKKMQIAVHCIGDRAVDIVLDAYEKCMDAKTLAERRCAIIHCQIISDKNIRRMKRLGVIAEIQPVFINYDWHIAESRLGRERAKRSYCWQRMMKEGVVTAFSTDCPVEDLRPVDNIYSAVTRKDLEGSPEGGWFPEEKMSIYDSLYCYTVNSAYASREEQLKGSVTAGKLADFVVFRDNIFDMPEDEIKNALVDMTVFNGEIIYERKI